MTDAGANREKVLNKKFLLKQFIYNIDLQFEKISKIYTKVDINKETQKSADFIKT